MLYSGRFVADAEYRQQWIADTTAGDRPLVVQFCGHDPDILGRACRLVEEAKFADAVDLNLGCPQRSAKSGHFGASLCDPEDRSLLLNMPEL